MAEAKVGKYYYAKGRRKTSVATIRLFNVKGDNKINDRDFTDFYSSQTYKVNLNRIFRTADLDPKDFHFTAKTSGGGITGQFDAMILAIARALIIMDPTLKAKLKTNDYLTRDSRMVERKKPGFRKARKKEQFSKR